jgi:hypothetical protein
MIIQSIQRLVSNVRDNVRTDVYTQVQDPKTNKVFYECVTYTYKGLIDSYLDKGQNIDTKS